MMSSIEHLHDVHCQSMGNQTQADVQDKVSSVNKRLEQAKTWCKQHGVRFTKLREQVYRLILQADKPMGAYDLLSLMQQQSNETSLVDNSSTAQSSASKSINKPKKPKKPSKNIAPPTVYRSLEFLLEEGFIHQLTSINAFVPCCHPREKHIAGFLICQSCDRVQECSNEAVHAFISHTNNDIGFAVEKTVIEVMGTCQTCQQSL